VTFSIVIDSSFRPLLVRLEKYSLEKIHCNGHSESVYRYNKAFNRSLFS